MKPRFLIVDDHEDTRVLLESMLHSLDCDVDQASDGSEALEAVDTEDKAKKYDAIFLDLMMPGLSGYHVIEKLKQKDFTKKIPIILLTAKGDGDDIIDGYQQGADYYIPKPFTRDQIVFGLDIVFGQEQEEGDPAAVDIS